VARRRRAKRSTNGSIVLLVLMVVVWTNATQTVRVILASVVLAALALAAWSAGAPDREHRRELLERQRRLEERQHEQELRSRRAQAERDAAMAARAEAAALREEQQRLRLERQAAMTAARAEAASAAATKRLEVQRRHDDMTATANTKTASVNEQLQQAEQLLQNRDRSLTLHSARLECIFTERGADSFAEEVQQLLDRPLWPGAGQGSVATGYRPESRELLIQCELPRQDAIPAVVRYRYAKAKQELVAEARKQAEVRLLYAALTARVALRVISEAFETTPHTLVTTVVFNGEVHTTDRATGKPIRPCLISLNATRDVFVEILLDNSDLDPVACLRTYLNAVVSPHPWDLEGVRPVLQFDLTNYKFVDEVDIVSGLDSRPDLLALKPVEFEHLIRQLFQARGLKSWVTQSSRDEGVDAVAVNEDPIVGGLCIIQAKRYSKIVGLEAIHALAGVMNDKAAAKGVLVTTSWVGKASRDFAARNGRMEIIDGRQLKSLLREHLGIDALISLPKQPPAWTSEDSS
jgi:restriction system protein